MTDLLTRLAQLTNPGLSSTESSNSETGDRVLVSDSQQQLTRDQLIVRCNELATLLKSSNSTIVALYGDNSCDWVTADLACQQANICLIPIPTFFSQSQINHVCTSLAVDTVICQTSEPFTAIPGASHHRQRTIFDGRYQLLQLDCSEPGAALPEGTQKITFTSGSTGQPKGVCLSAEQQLLQASALANAVAIDRPRHLCLLPLSTLLENIAGVYTPLLCGGEVIIPSLGEIGFQGSSSLNAEQFCGTISRCNPQSMILTPQLLVVAIAAVKQGWKPPASLEFVAVGGGRVSAQLLGEAHQYGIPAYEGYGLSECASVVSLNTRTESASGTSGKALPHLTVSVRNEEIIVSGNAMLGYAGQPDSWGQEIIETGDMGSVDSQGYITISGRSKNMLISSFGRNINPEWVESELVANTVIADAVVFGDDRPHCVALLCPRDPQLGDDAMQSIVDQVNAGLPDYARVVNWHRLQQPLQSQAGLVTDNGRPVRPAIAVHYQQALDSLYQPQQERLQHQFLQH